MFYKKFNSKDHDDDSLDGLSDIANEFDYFGRQLDKTLQELADKLGRKSSDYWQDLYEKESDPEKQFQYLSKWIDEPKYDGWNGKLKEGH